MHRIAARPDVRKARILLIAGRQPEVDRGAHRDHPPGGGALRLHRSGIVAVVDRGDPADDQPDIVEIEGGAR